MCEVDSWTHLKIGMKLYINMFLGKRERWRYRVLEDQRDSSITKVKCDYAIFYLLTIVLILKSNQFMPEKSFNMKRTSTLRGLSVKIQCLLKEMPTAQKNKLFVIGKLRKNKTMKSLSREYASVKQNDCVIFLPHRCITLMYKYRKMQKGNFFLLKTSYTTLRKFCVLKKSTSIFCHQVRGVCSRS